MTDAAAVKPTTTERPAELQAPGYEIFIALLAVISLINLAISVLPFFSASVEEIAQIVDKPLTAIFLLDFTSRLLRSTPKRTYFIDQKGWLDLLGSLPSFFRLFRIFRLLRVTRLMGEYGLGNIVRSFIRDRADNALLVVVFMVIVVLEFGSMAVAYFEQYAPGANITTGGRTAAVLVLAAGVGLFGVLSGYLANFFLAPSTKDESDTAAASAPAAPDAVLAGASASTGERADLLRMVEGLEADLNALRTRLASDPTG